jgi:NAD(P)-dependent dehydrogenase (short-subunit alcohol dehydrogenase family)
MSGKLDGKIAVITGGSTGIGLATAQKFVAEGAYVFITGRRQAELDAAVKLIGKNVTAVQSDVAKLADIDKLYETVAREKGKFDILVANAGIADQALTVDATPEHFAKVFDVNVRGTFFTVQKALKHLNDGAAIVAIASVVLYKGFPGTAVYSGTKGAIRAFVRTWAAEFKDRGIRVNAVSPGPIDTPMFDGIAKASPVGADAMRQQFATIVPLARLGRPEDIAEAALYLASDASGYVTGFDLIVDGGITQL